MSTYIRKNILLFILTILSSVIASLGYVFMAVLLQQLLDTAMEKNIHQFIRMVVFSIIYFVALGFSLYLQSLLSKKVICKIMLQIRSDVFRGIINHSIEDFEKKSACEFEFFAINIANLFENIVKTAIFNCTHNIATHFFAERHTNSTRSH